MGVHVVPEALLVRRAPYRGFELSPAGGEGAACSEREERSRCVYGRDYRIGRTRVEAAVGGFRGVRSGVSRRPGGTKDAAL